MERFQEGDLAGKCQEGPGSNLFTQCATRYCGFGILRTPSSYRALEAGTESVEFSYGDWQSARLKALGAGASFNCGLAHLLGILQGHQLPTLCPNEYPIRSPALLEIGIEGLPMSYSTSRYIEIEYPGACYCFWSSWDCIRRHRLGTVNTPTSVAL